VPPPFQRVSGTRKAKDWAATILVGLAFVVAVIPLVWLLGTVITAGYRALVSVQWWTHSLKGVLPEEFTGGVYHAIVGSLLQTVVCAVIAVPVGVLAAIYLVEYGRGRIARATTFMVDILSGVPSIVAALFIFALWIGTLGFQQSGFAVSLALVLLMLPVVVRSSEEMLRLVPQELREAAYALGVPKWKTIMRIVLPTALSGIVTGVMLALARVMGETAPVLVLVGYSRSINFNIFDGNMTSLPLLIYTELTNPTPAGQLRVWGAALTLIILVMLFNLVAVAISRFSAIKTK
jgi:phosphate transport system permease protein